MTFIKKYFKVILCFMAFALVSFAFAFAPTYTALAANQVISNYHLKISGAKINDVDLNAAETAEDKKLKIPVLNITNFGDTAELTIRVFDPSMNSHDYIVGGENNAYFGENSDGTISPLALTSGTYTVVYIVKVGEKVYTSTPRYAKVSNAKYEFVSQIVDNDGAKILLPSKIEQNSQKAYKLPIAKVKNSANTEGTTFAPDMIRLTTNNGNDIIDLVEGTSAEDFTKKFFVYNGDYYFVPSVVGEYKLTYGYSIGDNPPQETITFEVQSEADFVAPTTEELKINDPSISGIVLGKTGITLHDVTMSAKGESAIEHNTTIVIKCGDYSQTLVNKFTFDLTLDKFTNGAGENPTSWNDLKGDYTFEYTVVDAYGEDFGRKVTKSFTYKDVKNNETPNITMSYDYDLNADGSIKGEVKTDKEVSFNTTMGYDEIVIPAVYATDAVSEFEDFSFIRYIQRTSNSKNYYVDNVKRDGSSVVALKITEDEEKGTFSFEDGWNFALVDYSSVKFVKSDDIASLSADYNGKYIIEVENGTFKFKGIYNSAEATFDTTSDNAKLWKEKLGQRDLEKTKIETNKQQAFKFSYDSNIVKDGDFDGEYKIYYWAIVKNDVKTKDGSKDYTITISKDANFDREIKKTPIVSFDSNKFIPNEINSDEELNIEVVANDSTDSSLKTILFYTYTYPTDMGDDVRTAIDTLHQDSSTAYSHIFDNSAFRSATGFNYVDPTAENKNEFSFTLENVSTNKEVYVVAMAMNNDGIVGFSSVKTIVIKNNITDNAAPTVDNIVLDDASKLYYDDGENKVIKLDYEVKNDGETIVLPTVTFGDDDEYLSLSAKYYVMTEGQKEIDINDFKGITPDYTIETKNTLGGSITPTQNVEGTYYVVYTATDDAGNTTVMYFVFDVADRSYPIASINVTGNGLTEAGNIATVKAGVEVSYEGIVKSSKGFDVTSDATIKSIRVKSKDGLSVDDKGNNVVIFEEVGMYEIEFTAEYNGKEVTVRKYVQVDGILPAEWTNLVDRIGEKPKSGEDYGYVDLSTTEAVKLPTLEAMRWEEHKLYVSVKVTRQGTDVEVTDNTFMPSVKGTYTVTYNAYESAQDRKDAKNSVLTKTYTVKVGDDEKPVLKISNKAKLEEKLVLEGKDIDYKLTINSEGKIEVEINNNGKITKIDTGFTMSDIDSKGNENALDRNDMTVTFSSDSDYSTKESTSSFKHYKLEEAGKYTVKIKVNDGRGNSNEISYSFNVIDKATAGKVNKDNKLGTILIIVSSVLLVGIVAFFLIASRKGKGGKKKSNKTSVTSSNVVENKETTVEETKTEETKSEEAKSGDVE